MALKQALHNTDFLPAGPIGRKEFVLEKVSRKNAVKASRLNSVLTAATTCRIPVHYTYGEKIRMLGEIFKLHGLKNPFLKPITECYLKEEDRFLSVEKLLQEMKKQ